MNTMERSVHELTVDQMRETFACAGGTATPRSSCTTSRGGSFVEARRSGHAIELERFDWSGAVTPDQPIALAA